MLTVGERHVFSGSWDKTIRVWDAETLTCLKTLEGHGEAVLALAVGPQHLISGVLKLPDDLFCLCVTTNFHALSFSLIVGH